MHHNIEFILFKVIICKFFNCHVCFCCWYFFFSSRRRHTRWPRDWSSDVCSSDLRLGWEEHATDWREVIAREDIDIVDVCTPGFLHAEIAIAALEAGKHVLCEKPLANDTAEAEAMVTAARAARQREIGRAHV